tara:strand:- start:2275 stop:2529 length:255 start_codon:yes stop_codon:yes gene_type:complete
MGADGEVGELEIVHGVEKLGRQDLFPGWRMGLALLRTADTMADTSGKRNRTTRKRWFLTNILLRKLFDSTAMLWALILLHFGRN